jgi:hypothetical protein
MAVCAPLVLLFVALLATGCHHVPADTGGSSFVVLDPPPPPASKVEAKDARINPGTDYFRDALPILPLVQPIYPPRALAAKAGRVTVGVRVTVDVNGHISDIEPSMRAFSTPGPYAEDFLAAVRAALDKWRFEPAAIDHIEHVTTPEASYNRVVRTEPAETYFDLIFNFTATGSVLPASSAK